jgi:hypothetical protein
MILKRARGEWSVRARRQKAASSLLGESTRIILEGTSYAIKQHPRAPTGTGYRYLVTDGQTDFHLKLFYPFLCSDIREHLSDSEAEVELAAIADYVVGYFQAIARLSHPNIVRVTGCGLYTLRDSVAHRLTKRVHQVPYMLTPHLLGRSLEDSIPEWLADSAKITTPVTIARFCKILVEIVGTLRYLDQNCLMHADICADNIIVVEPDYRPVMIDFALGHYARLPSLQKVKRSSDPAPSLHVAAAYPVGPDHPLHLLLKCGNDAETRVATARPGLDLLLFGRLLRQLGSALPPILPSPDHRYLSLISRELTNWEKAKQWTTDQLVSRIGRLSSDHYTFFGVPEMRFPTTPQSMIRLPIGGVIPITDRIERFIDNRSFRRLAYVNQLSFVGLLYPGADYNRRLHMLHCYQLAREIMRHLYAAPFFRLHFNVEACTQMLSAVLLHDINHFPFLHTFQESDRGEVPEVHDADLIDWFCEGEMTGENARGEKSLYKLLEDIGLNRERFKSTIKKDQAISSKRKIK